MRRNVARISLAFAVAIALAGCGSSESPGGGARGGSPGGGAGNRSVTIASPSRAGFSLYMTADRLNQQGWNVEFVAFQGNDLAFQALIENEAQISHGATGNAMLAVQKGADIRLVADRNRPEWVLVSNTKINRCEDIKPSTRAAHSSTGDSILPQMKPYFDTCGAKPTILVIADSANRLAALQAGELDQAPVELSDWVKLSKDQPGKFKALSFLGDNLPDLSTAGIYASGKWLNENHDVAVQFFTEMLKTVRSIYQDPTLLEAAAAKHLKGGSTPEVVRDQIKEYTAKQMWPVNGGLTDDVVKFTIDWNVDRDYLEPGLTTAQVFEPSVLADSLKAVGAEPGKD
jgi:ABC-type nitrate/sulfonate/bicarbonate transport system substrate-binding protein